MFFKPVKAQAPFSRRKIANVYKTKTQLLQEFLKTHNGPLTLKNSKFLNAQVKIHKKRKEIANKQRQLIVVNQPTISIFKPKPKAAPKSAAPKSLKKTKNKTTKANCTTPRCKALKMKNQKVCDAKIKNGGAFCKRHRKK